MLSKTIQKQVVRSSSRLVPSVSVGATKALSTYQPKRVAKRPVSPDVGIYKFPVPAISSIMNRVTGAALSVGFVGMGLAAAGGNLDCAITAIQNSGVLLPAAKFSVSFPLIYHYAGGLRHLYWDATASGLELDSVRSSSTALIGGSVVAAAAVSAISF